MELELLEALSLALLLSTSDLLLALLIGALEESVPPQAARPITRPSPKNKFVNFFILFFPFPFVINTY